jgi:hypothetical protein
VITVVISWIVAAGWGGIMDLGVVTFDLHQAQSQLKPFFSCIFTRSSYSESPLLGLKYITGICPHFSGGSLWDVSILAAFRARTNFPPTGNCNDNTDRKNSRYIDVENSRELNLCIISWKTHKSNKTPR